jgi:YidC/Oxa1 family membrane protein insertase
MNIWDTFIITPFVNVLLLIYNYIGSFGIAIILFTILIRLITHPLMVKQIKSAQAMQSLTQDKRYKAMQEKYKGQKEKLAQAQMELYKEMGVSPFASCLPTLIQLPLIIGLYQSLTRAMASTPAEMLYLKQHIYTGLLNVSTLIPLNSHFLWMNLAQPERLVSRSWPSLW